MVWCFSTRASVATVLTTHPCVSRCLRVKVLISHWNLAVISVFVLLRCLPNFSDWKTITTNLPPSRLARSHSILKQPSGPDWGLNIKLLDLQCMCDWDMTPLHLALNTLRSRQNGRRFADDTFKCIFLNENEFRLRFHWTLFLRVQLTIIQHWFRKWLGAG